MENRLNDAKLFSSDYLNQIRVPKTIWLAAMIFGNKFKLTDGIKRSFDLIFKSLFVPSSMYI